MSVVLHMVEAGGWLVLSGLVAWIVAILAAMHNLSFGGIGDMLLAACVTFALMMWGGIWLAGTFW